MDDSFREEAHEPLKKKKSTLQITGGKLMPFAPPPTPKWVCIKDVRVFIYCSSIAERNGLIVFGTREKLLSTLHPAWCH